MSWRQMSIGDLVTLQRGHDLTDAERKEGSVPVIGSAGPNGTHNVALQKGPGFTIGRSGASVGKVTFVASDYWPHKTCLYARDLKGNDPRFLAYFLSLQNLAQLNSGAAQPSLNRNFVHAQKVMAPDLPTQQRLASILSAYDDLIENNRRRIALLEQAARLLYREWFVHLRFPGYETAKIVDGLPEGWERATLGQVADEVDYGFTASASLDVEGPRFLRITDIVSGAINWHQVPRCEIPEGRLKKFSLKEGDVVVARTGATTGWARRIGELAEQAVFASYLVRFRFGQRIDAVLAATFMESDLYKTTIQGRLGGAAQPNASAKVLAGVEIAVPPRDLQNDFKDQICETNRFVDLLIKENAKLTRARDLLLPRLMDGRIPV